MSGRNPMGARLPPSATERPPARLPDGSESQHHGGSFGAYMAHKERKLQEQFQAQAAGLQRSQLFAGVAIHVNGLTSPSHLELKQLMALHGGEFHNYYHRDSVTHIVCCNLPDAKVKQLQKERSPTPIVRPEWVVDCIQAGRLLPIQDYALYQLRDAPGQQKLRAFQQVRPAALPAEAIYPANFKPSTAAGPAIVAAEGPPSAAAVGQPDVTEGGQQGPASFSFPAPPPPPQQPQQLQQQQPQPQAEQQPVSGHEQPPAGGPQQGWAFGAGGHAGQAAGGMRSLPPAGVPPSRAAAAAAAGREEPHSPFAAAVAAAAAEGPGEGAVPTGRRSPAAGYSAGELREAQQLASRLRAECDMLKGPPKSTRDDPNFVQSFYKSSRLHFIGTWKARIETLMESDAARRGPQPAPNLPGRPRVVMHIDMDCFFASVTEAAHPVFKGKPLAVCHSASAHGTGEVSTCNYEARAFGVRSGMMISRAKDLCPDLIVVPYMFDKYEETSEKVYGILLRHSACVQALSCDEAYLDVTGLGDPEQLAATIRAEIAAATGCTASAGIGPNPLLARISTDHAKPNGQLAVTQAAAAQYLQALPVKDLPGVGWSTGQKLESRGITTVAEVLARSKEFLQAELGPKLGVQLWDYAHGRDDRRVEPPKKRKSVGAEVNWGVRFQSDDDARRLLDSIAADVRQRLQQGGLKGRRLTLKLKRRKQGAAEPLKFMGHGDCDNLSRSVTLARFTDSAEDIGRECWELLRAARVPFADIRGMGITVQLLNNDSSSFSARPGAQAPSKLAAPPATRADPDVWANFWRQQEAPLPPPQAPQQAQAQQAQQAQQSPGKAPSPVPPLPAEAALSSLQAAADAQQHQRRHDAQEQEQQQQAQAAEPSAHHQGKTSPAAGKQRSVAALLERHAAAEAGGAAGHAGAAHDAAARDAQQRQQLVDQWQGVTLSQMDASVLAALPWSVQKELIATLPRGRPQQQADTSQQPTLAQRLKAVAPAHAEAAEAPPPPPPQQEQQEPEGMATDEAAGMEAQQEQHQRRQQQSLKRPLDGQESSDEEAGWEPDSQPEQDTRAWGAAAAAAAAMTGTPRQQQQQQQQAGGGSSRAEEAGPSGSRPGTPIAALPAFSQVDPSVLEALPLEVRWELEHAYGIRRPRQPAPLAHPGRGRGGGAATHVRPTSKRQRLDSFLSNPPPYGVTAGGRAVAARQQQLEQQRLSLSQVDPAVLAELPPDVQQEVVQQLQAAGGSLGGPAGRKQRLQQRSRLGQQRDEAQAWQQRWAEEQRQRDAEAAAAVQAAGGLLSQGSDLVGQLLSPPEQPEQQEEEEEEEEEEEQEGAASQEHGAPPLLPAVQHFAELVAGKQMGSWATDLAAALASCLDQLEGQAEEAAGQDASPRPQQQEQQEPQRQQRHQPSAQHSLSFGGASGGSHSSGGEAADSPGGSAGSGSLGDNRGGSREADLPPTQPVELEMQDAPAAHDGPAEAAAAGGADGLDPAGAEAGHAGPPQHAQGVQQAQQGAQQAQQEPASPAAACGPPNSPGAGSPANPRARELQRSLHALGRSLQQAAAGLLAARDLEQLRLLLLAVQRLGRQHPWFAEAAGQAAVDAAQQGVQAQYGWRLRLGPGLLEAAPAAEGSRG